MRPTARPRRRGGIAFLASACLLGFVSLAPAQGRDEYGSAQNPDSNGARDEYGEIQQTVARISHIDGSASFARGDDPDNWQSADQNVPMTLGDKVYTGKRSRLELQIQGGDSIRLGAETDLSALNLTDDTKQFSITGGIASFRIRRLDDNEVFEIDTPNAAVTIERPGDYRVDVDPNGNSHVSVRSGQATVAAGGGQVPVQSGDQIRVDGTDSPQYDVVALGAADAWDRWVEQRDTHAQKAQSLRYVSADVVGADDLDEYGRWEDVPQYGRVWTPSAVAADWVPYRVGHWIWQDPWGWTWVSTEPWGWAPYHYGRWVTYSSRWYWVPVAQSVRIATYSPALVAFVGGGPGWSASATVGGGGFVGWFPLGPRDPFNHWWSRRAPVNVTNVTYVNRTYVTVVNQNTFVSGGVVNTGFVRDRSVIQGVVSAPVLRGPLPMVPTAASLRVAVRPGLPAPPRPPAAILARPVVARVAPPPAPPAFQAKLAVIRQNRGAPVTQVESARISVENRGRPQAISNVRPVAAESGKVTLVPRGGTAATAARKVEPIKAEAGRGRPMATSQQPVSAAPVVSTTGPSRGRDSGTGASQSLPSVERGNIQRGNTPSVQTGRPVTLDRGNVQRGNTPSVQTGRPEAVQRGNVPVLRTPVPNENGPEHRRPGRDIVTPEPRPTPRSLERGNARESERVVRPTPSTNNRSTIDRSTNDERTTNDGRGRVERPTPVPRGSTTSQGAEAESGRGRERQVVTPPPRETGQTHAQPERVERQPNPQPPPKGDEKKAKPKPEKTPKKD